MIKNLAIAIGALGLAATPLLTATSASATTSSWVRDRISAGSCTATQTILEGYNGSSHEYQEGIVTAGGSNCYVLIIQYINGNQGSNSGWHNWSTPVYYDGPNYQDQVCLWDVNSGASNCTTTY